MLVVDVETTGLDSTRHSIISIGAVDFAAPARQFYRECRPWDGAEFDLDALAVNGTTPEQLADTSRPSLEKVIGEFISWASEAEDRTLAGMNTFFDRDFLRVGCNKYNMSWIFGHRILDLHSICWAHTIQVGKGPQIRYGRVALNSDAIMQYVGLPTEPRPHNGLTGAKMEAEAFSRLVIHKGLLEEFKGHPLPEYLNPSGGPQSSLL